MLKFFPPLATKALKHSNQVHDYNTSLVFGPISVVDVVLKHPLRYLSTHLYAFPPSTIDLKLPNQILVDQLFCETFGALTADRKGGVIIIPGFHISLKTPCPS